MIAADSESGWAWLEAHISEFGTRAFGYALSEGQGTGLCVFGDMEN